MISFNLVCRDGHEFEGWFSSSAAYEQQKADGTVTCPHCGTPEVSKTLMSPNIGVRENRSVKAAADPKPTGEMVEFLRQMRKYVQNNADYVGEKFAEEARKIHYEETDPRGIYGETSADDAKALIEEGIEVFPLPVLPEDKN